MHVGVRGNERVDALAKAAAVRPAGARCPLSASDYHSVILSAVRPCWQLRWDSVVCCQTRIIIFLVYSYISVNHVG